MPDHIDDDTIKLMTGKLSINYREFKDPKKVTCEVLGGHHEVHMAQYDKKEWALSRLICYRGSNNESFGRELKILHHVGSLKKHVMELIWVSEDPKNGDYISVTPWAPCDLGMLLEKNSNLGWYWKKTLASQIVRGLNHIHSQNVIHRNLSPTNILIGRKGEAIITNFSVAINETIKAPEESILLKARQLQYFPPECYHREYFWGHFGKPGDIFCLSQIIWAIARGHERHKDKNGTEIKGPMEEGNPYDVTRDENNGLYQIWNDLYERLHDATPSRRPDISTIEIKFRLMDKYKEKNGRTRGPLHIPAWLGQPINIPEEPAADEPSPSEYLDV